MDQLTSPASVYPQSESSPAYDAAIQLLHDCCSPWGIAASGDRGGYHNLWARDAMISSLGILATTDTKLHHAVHTSLLSLAAHQTELGLIPNKIDFGENKRVNFRAYGDGGLWFVLLVARYLLLYPDCPEKDALYAAAEKSLLWYRYQDHDQSGLIAIQEGASWMDLFPLRGKSIYINALRYWATNELSQIATRYGANDTADKLAQETVSIRAAIQEKLWYEPGKDIALIIQDSFSTSSYNEAGYDALGRKLLLPEKKLLADEAYFLPYVTLRDFGEWFDTLGNLIAVVSGLATPIQRTAILDFITAHDLAKPFPIKAIYPTLEPGDPDWRYYFAFGDLNYPEQYHNGGVWPMIGGFYVWSLTCHGDQVAAKRMLEELAEANQTGPSDTPWEFNEYLHGQTARPMGMQDQAWSAAMYLAAHHATCTMPQKTNTTAASYVPTR